MHNFAVCPSYSHSIIYCGLYNHLSSIFGPSGMLLEVFNNYTFISLIQSPGIVVNAIIDYVVSCPFDITDALLGFFLMSLCILYLLFQLAVFFDVIGCGCIHVGLDWQELTLGRGWFKVHHFKRGSCLQHWGNLFKCIVCVCSYKGEVNLWPFERNEAKRYATHSFYFVSKCWNNNNKYHSH